jgi:SAM-dependent methyltransferase
VQLTVPQSVRAQLEFNTALAAARVYGPQAALETAFATAAAAFETAHGHAPRSLDEVEAVVAGLSEFQADRTLTATLSRRMWRELRRLVELNEARVDEQLRAMPDQALGALYLDPNLVEPDYYASSSFHLAPGNYSGSYIYAIHNDSELTPIVSRRTWPSVHQIFEQAVPKGPYGRIVDLGAGLGRSTVALKEVFPAAEVIGVDLAERELRYAHWESERRGLAITYLQADATRTPLPSASADLVVAYILQHELPPEAMRVLLREAWRVLRPGGVFMNGDVTPSRHMLPLTRYLLGLQVRTGSEPYWLVAGDLDLPAEFAACGFGQVREQAPPHHPHGLHFPWWTIGEKPR